MSQLKDTIQSGLDESRMLILGAQILLGFAFSATFEAGFQSLSQASRQATLIHLTLLFITVCFLI
jgi:hypothetical protein